MHSSKYHIQSYLGLAKKENNFLFRKIGDPQSFIIGIDSIIEQLVKLPYIQYVLSNKLHTILLLK